MRSTTGAFLLVASAASMVGASPSQDSATVPGIQTEVVRLDAVVTDEKGKLVTNLKAEDFKISEDGKAQRVVQFVVAGRPAAAPEPTATVEVPPQPGEEAAAEVPRGPGRQIVVVVDDLHIARGNIDFTRDALRRVVQEFFAPEDKVALVMTSGTPGVPRLTQDRAGLAQAVNRLVFREVGAVQARSTDMTPEQAELIMRGDMNALKFTARSIAQEAGSQYSTDSPLAQLTTTGTPVPAGLERNEVPAADEAKRQARAVLAGALHYSVATLATVESVLRSLAPLPGRKLCLLVSDGFLVGTGTSEERVRDMRNVVDAATRSGAVVYTLDAGGLTTRARDASAPVGSGSLPDLEHGMDRDSEQLLRTTLETVSSDTGGFLVRGTNDLAGGLNRMLRDNETYYLLAYEPTNSKRDGKFRRIDVKIAQHNDFTVRTRRGYFAPDGRRVTASRVPAGSLALPPPVALPHVLDAGEARSLLSTPLPASGGIPVRLAADYLDLPHDGPKAIVRTQMDVSRMQWQKADGRYRAAIDLVGGLYDADGKAVGEPFAKHAELDLSGADFKKIVEEGLPYQVVMPIAPGRYQVRAVAHESKLGQAGGAARWIEVPDLSSRMLAMSSLFLSTPSGKTEDPQASLRDMQALRRFERNGSLYFQSYIYNAQVDDKGARDVILQAQIWSGSEMVAASKPLPPRFLEKNGAPTPETNGMSLKGLKPGAYELKVVVVDHLAGAEVSRNIDFTIE